MKYSFTILGFFLLSSIASAENWVCVPTYIAHVEESSTGWGTSELPTDRLSGSWVIAEGEWIDNSNDTVYHSAITKVGRKAPEFLCLEPKDNRKTISCKTYMENEFGEFKLDNQTYRYVITWIGVNFDLVVIETGKCSPV